MNIYFNFENERMFPDIYALVDNALHKIVLILRFFNKIV